MQLWGAGQRLCREVTVPTVWAREAEPRFCLWTPVNRDSCSHTGAVLVHKAEPRLHGVQLWRILFIQGLGSKAEGVLVSML